MTVLSRLLRAPQASERRSDPSLIPGPLDVDGGSAPFRTPSEQRAMRHSAVWAAVELRAGLMSSFSAHAFVDIEEGHRQRVYPTPSILKRPTPGDAGTGVSMAEFLSAGEASLMLRGNCFATITRDFAMRPTGLVMLDPDSVAVEWDKDAQAVGYEVGGVPISPKNMWHRRRHLIPGTCVGMSALHSARVAIQMGLSAEEFGARFFTDGAHPTGMLKKKPVPGSSGSGDLTKEQADLAKDRWNHAIRGGREIAVLGGDWEYTQIQVSPSDSQFLDAIAANIATIARFMDVPPEMIGGSASGGPSLTYANLSDRANHLLVFHMASAIKSWEEGLSEVLAGGMLAGQYCRLDTDSMLRLNPKEQAEVNAIRLANGETCPDELRAARDLPPLPDGQGQIFVWPPKPVTFMSPTQGAAGA